MKARPFSIAGNIVDVVNRRIFAGTLHVENGMIASISELPSDLKESLPYLLPGFIDAHVHIESSMLIPSEFARLAVVHGTVGTVSDPHEIANVLGMEGVRFMIRNGRKVPFKFCFGAPSCVPATAFESSGAEVSAGDIEKLLQLDDIGYLSEVMNYPGVIHDDASVMQKIRLAHNAGKVIDGHAPGLAGDDLKKYVSAGISTDHECFTIKEAREKIALGMKVLIREGSAAKNFDELIPLLNECPESIMLCSDDKHPFDLIDGHINLLVKRALDQGYELFDVLRSVTLNPKQHYGLDNGLLQTGDAADFLAVDNLTDLNVLQTYINGKKVAGKGKTLIRPVKEKAVNRFFCDPITPEQLKVPATGKYIRVIHAIDGQLITKTLCTDARIENGCVITNPDLIGLTKYGPDILKIVVYNRYRKSEPAVAFIHGFGLVNGAIASSVAHDSHNIIAVGCNDQDISRAVNLLIEKQGGIVVTAGGIDTLLPLPVAGIMTTADGYETARQFVRVDARTRRLCNSGMEAPFITLSFMALLVIPELKLSDQGLFDGNTFRFTSLFCD